MPTPDVQPSILQEIQQLKAQLGHGDWAEPNWATDCHTTQLVAQNERKTHETATKLLGPDSALARKQAIEILLADARVRNACPKK